MNETLQTIITRRSCKKYKPDRVPPEIVEQVIQAGLYAPSGMGKQSPIVLAVTDRALREKDRTPFTAPRWYWWYWRTGTYPPRSMTGALCWAI